MVGDAVVSCKFLQFFPLQSLAGDHQINVVAPLREQYDRAQQNIYAFARDEMTGSQNEMRWQELTGSDHRTRRKVDRRRGWDNRMIAFEARKDLREFHKKAVRNGDNFVRARKQP